MPEKKEKLLKKGNDHSFYSHLEELRKRILWLLLILSLFTILFFTFFNELSLFSLFTFPLKQIKQQLYFYNIMEPFMVRMKISVILAVIFTLPFFIFHILRFILPGLKQQEKKILFLLLSLTILLFFSGIGFSYYLLLPFSVKFLIQFAPPEIKPILGLKEYTNLFISIVISGGIIFLFPVLILFLNRVKLVSYKFLVRNIPYAVLVILIIAAILTPPDVVSQILLSIPLFILYLISILLTWIMNKKS